MAMTRWEPFESLTPLRDAMNQFLEESLLRPMRFGPMGRLFPVDVYETEEAFIVEAFIVEAVLPGVKPDDIRVTAIRDILTIHATIKPTPRAKSENGKGEKGEKGEKTATYMQRERYTGEMTGTIQLPTAVEPDKVSATYTHGMLILQVPKVAVAEPTTIPVRVPEEPATH